MKRLAVLPVAAVLALSAAYTRDAPTAPAVAEIAPPTAAPLVISSAALAAFGAAVEAAPAGTARQASGVTFVHRKGARSREKPSDCARSRSGVAQVMHP